MMLSVLSRLFQRYLTMAFMISLVAALAGCKSASQVETSYGTIEGKKDGAVTEFLGIPYAKPPVGELRWADPQPAEPWANVLKAKSKGHACIQYGVGLPAFYPDEDC